MCRKLDLRNVRIYANTKADIADAMNLIGEEVYLSDRTDFGLHTKAKLTGVIYAEDDDCPFFRRAGNQSQWGYRYLIRATDAKFIEGQPKKLRPFNSISEFCNETGCEEIGVDDITIRNKEDKKEYVLLYVGYSDDEVHLGGYIYTFAYLLKHYEFLYNCEWQPFGIEE